jgi:exodeoxyribonuclease VII small subunit
MKFEQALSGLEEIVARLESGECTLEEALDLYARGVQLLKLCSGHLSEAEQKVEILVKGEREPFVLEKAHEGV